MCVSHWNVKNKLTSIDPNRIREVHDTKEKNEFRVPKLFSVSLKMYRIYIYDTLSRVNMTFFRNNVIMSNLNEIKTG